MTGETNRYGSSCVPALPASGGGGGALGIRGFSRSRPFLVRLAVEAVR